MKGNQLSLQPDATSSMHAQRWLALGLALASSTRDEMLVMIARTAAELTESELAFFLLLDATTGKLHQAPRSDTKNGGEETLPMEGSAGGWVLRQSQPLVLGSESPKLTDFIDLKTIGVAAARNLVALPLSTRGRSLGVLEVCNKRGRDYDKDDVDLLQGLAAVAAISCDNNHLLQQTDLIAEFMHEVKTPLMALTAASELLARDLRDQKQIELIMMIQRETLRLSKMAQDFLDLTRLESGRAQIAHEPVDLAELIHDVVQLQKPQAGSRGITISVSIDEGLPVILGDYDRLRQVFLNLTSNAIKYNRENGHVTIRVCQLNGELLVEIGDTGPGIARENLPHLFERFYRIPDSEGFTKGTGLGLSIAARLLREHGGRIDVQSELGVGSTFRCYLPFQL